MPLNSARASTLFGASGVKPSRHLSVGSGNNFALGVWNWSVAGFGSRFANPATPANLAQRKKQSFTAIGDAIAASGNAPRLLGYPFSTSGFGTQYAAPGTSIPADTTSTRFTPADDFVAVTHPTTPFTTVFAFNPSTGFGSKTANPAVSIGFTSNESHWHPLQNAVAIAVQGAPPDLVAYAWSPTGFGTRFAAPSPTSAGFGFSVNFNKAGNAIAYGHGDTPRLDVYAWSGSGFGTRFARVASMANNGSAVRFNVNDTALLGAAPDATRIHTFAWDNVTGVGTKFSNPAVLPTGNAKDANFSAEGNAIAVSHETTPFVTAYPFSPSGYGTKFTNPAVLPTDTGGEGGISFGS